MAPLAAFHRTPLPPTGVAYAVSCRLFESRSSRRSAPHHLITARDNALAIWDISVPLSSCRVDPDSSKPDPPAFVLSQSGAQISHIRSHRLHGVVTSVSVVQTLQSKRDGRDRILVSFEQAKMSLLEWNDLEFDLVPVSLHTFEKLPQVVRSLSLYISF